MRIHAFVHDDSINTMQQRVNILAKNRHVLALYGAIARIAPLNEVLFVANPSYVSHKQV